MTDEPDPYEAIVTQHRMLCDAVDEQGNAGACPGAVLDLAEDAETEEQDLAPADVEAAILTAFRTLPVTPSTIHHQPKGEWTLVNLDFIVYTDTTPQVLSTDVLGVPLTFTLTPAHWTWDFGDGSPPLASSNPGAPYPEHTIAHPYTAASDGVSITLTTLWSGTYQINGTGTHWPVQGFVTTTSTAGPIEVHTARTRLVTDS